MREVVKFSKAFVLSKILQIFFVGDGCAFVAGKCFNTGLDATIRIRDLAPNGVNLTGKAM